ncbi:helix-turn-helix domain-containing protein [Asanoa siamensis]|uniref:helix-turn-helix domain-containing protein n=1 Tax=Asanoa siamensis TaxID=926357 RepID=UPI0019456E6E|nr:helix-turn-helix transcriptional regulator [Asanoa siamensis]
MSELGHFLKAKRAAIRPEDVGLPAIGNPRRVVGLRREEVAYLAAVSADHYTRLEQGRVTTASNNILDGLARALKLTDDEHAYLRLLTQPDSRRRPASRSAQVAAPVQDLLDALGPTPALLLGRRTDLLAWNTAATALFLDFAVLPRQHRNLVRLVFLEPRVRDLYADWKRVAAEAVARLRMDAVHTPNDPQLAQLVGELCLQDDDFRRWWAGHDVRITSAGRKRLHHPLIGTVDLDWQALRLCATADQTLVTYTAPTGSASHDALSILSCWSSDTHAVNDRNQAPPPFAAAPEGRFQGQRRDGSRWAGPRDGA